MNKKWMAFLLVIGSTGLWSCQSVKPYQRAYLNDHEMALGERDLNHFQQNIHAYREGATGGGSGKASGGCGCN